MWECVNGKEPSPQIELILVFESLDDDDMDDTMESSGEEKQLSRPTTPSRNALHERSKSNISTNETQTPVPSDGASQLFDDDLPLQTLDFTFQSRVAIGISLRVNRHNQMLQVAVVKEGCQAEELGVQPGMSTVTKKATVVSNGIVHCLMVVYVLVFL